MTGQLCLVYEYSYTVAQSQVCDTGSLGFFDGIGRFYEKGRGAVARRRGAGTSVQNLQRARWGLRPMRAQAIGGSQKASAGEAGS